MVDFKQQAVAWLRAVLAETGLTPAELARKAKISPTTLTRPLNNPSHPYALSGRTIAAIARVAGRQPPRWAGGDALSSWDELREDLPLAVPVGKPRNRRAAAAMDIVVIPEFSTDSKAFHDPIAYWPFERSFIGELNPDKLAVYKVAGVAMYEQGDHIVVNRADTRLSSGSVFALWDGEAVIFRRVERLPAPKGVKTARIVLSADNKLVNDREVDAEWLDPIGRAVLLVRRLSK